MEIEIVNAFLNAATVANLDYVELDQRLRKADASAEIVAALDASSANRREVGRMFSEARNLVRGSSNPATANAVIEFIDNRAHIVGGTPELVDFTFALFKNLPLDMDFDSQASETLDRFNSSLVPWCDLSSQFGGNLDKIVEEHGQYAASCLNSLGPEAFSRGPAQPLPPHFRKSLQAMFDEALAELDERQL